MKSRKRLARYYLQDRHSCLVQGDTDTVENCGVSSFFGCCYSIPMGVSTFFGCCYSFPMVMSSFFSCCYSIPMGVSSFFNCDYSFPMDVGGAIPCFISHLRAVLFPSTSACTVEVDISMHSGGRRQHARGGRRQHACGGRRQHAQ